MEIFLILLIIFFLIINFNVENFTKNNYNLMNHQDVKNILKNNKKILIINVLVKYYYDDCYIKNSINWPVKDILKNHKYIPSIKKNIDYDIELIIYCAHENCYTSKIAVDILRSKGFKNVYRYIGGMSDWFLSGNESVGKCNVKEYSRCKNNDCYLPIEPI